ncbi:uncharacterized protein EI90DRAFT_3010970 [Cantharellus anzutake]|uniref:uncharacterized protein n=1 Tax=Cantharellus anzutake TaxID=1750568 RepID=UPI0019049EAD|nr:uncharacterized protein EI90DRAFT_3010970 [Cantharellus anzutake]KAF8344184.1 hypothetical protein EI90DRAFT_3010970 [Cantharellus anzutake]
MFPASLNYSMGQKHSALKHRCWWPFLAEYLWVLRVASYYAYLGANAKDAGKVIPKSTKDVDNLNGIATVEATTSVPSKDGCPPGTVPMKQHLRPMLPSSKTGSGAHRSGPLYQGPRGGIYSDSPSVVFTEEAESASKKARKLETKKNKRNREKDEIDDIFGSL